MADVRKIKVEEAKSYSKKYNSKKKYDKEKPRPNTEVNPAYKDTKEYMMPWVENIYSLFKMNNTWMGSVYNEISIMRSYQDGNQPVSQYRDYMFGKKEQSKNDPSIDANGWDLRTNDLTKEAQRTAWVNIDEKPVSIGPKIMTRLLEKANDLYYEIGVNAVDTISVQNEQLDKAKLWFYKENQKWIKEQMAIVGIKKEEPEFLPINMNELEMYALSGGFKRPYAINLETLLKHTYEISDWDKEVREKVLKDLTAFGYAIVRDYYDPEEMRVKTKWVDPNLGGIQYTNEFSFKDTEYGFELEFWPISKIRQKFDLTHEEAVGLAYSYSGQYGNPTVEAGWDMYGYQNVVDRGYGFDFYRIPVFKCEFLDVDNEKYYKHTTKNGRVFKKKLKNKDPEGLEVYDNRVRYVRQATWVVGTSLMCEYGKVPYMVRTNPKKPRISYRGIKLGTPSLFHQIRPFLDGLTLTWWKAQQAIAIAISNGIAVDVGALKNITIGKEKSWDVTNVLNYYRQQAILLHKKGNALGFGTASGPPVTPLVLGMEKNIETQFAIMDRLMMNIEQISGISLVAQSTPEPRTGKFNMQVAMQNTNQIIGSVIRAATDLQSDVGTNVIYRIRRLCKNNKSIAKSYENVIGEQKMKIILEAEKDNVQYGLKVEARDISEMRMFIEEILAASIKQNATGEVPGLLDPAEVLHVRDMLEQKQNIRFISLTLGYMLNRKGKEAEQKKMQMIELQGEQTRKAAMEQQRGKQQEQQFEMEKLLKQFEADFMLKYKEHPSQMMMQYQQQQQGMQPGQPQPAEQAMGAPQQEGAPQGVPAEQALGQQP